MSGLGPAALGPAERHRVVASGFAERVRGVVDWEVGSPVEGWSARDVVAHLVDWFPAFLAAGGVEFPAGPDVRVEPVAAWDHQAATVQVLLDGPDADRPFTHPFAGEHALQDAVDRFYVADVFMHTWDLARASGQDDRLDADFCAVLLEGMRPIEDLLRGSGQYGPAVPVPDDAPVQDRLLGFVGRDPAWVPIR